MTSSTPPTANRVMELPVRGMDCAECTQHVQHALCTLPGIESAQVFLSSEKAVVRYDPTQVNMSTMRGAVEAAGYSIPLHVIELPVKEGQAIKKGDLLVKIKPDFYVANRNQAEASYKSAAAGKSIATPKPLA